MKDQGSVISDYPGNNSFSYSDEDKTLSRSQRQGEYKANYQDAAFCSSGSQYPLAVKTLDYGHRSRSSDIIMQSTEGIRRNRGYRQEAELLERRSKPYPDSLMLNHSHDGYQDETRQGGSSRSVDCNQASSGNESIRTVGPALQYNNTPNRPRQEAQGLMRIPAPQELETNMRKPENSRQPTKVGNQGMIPQHQSENDYKGVNHTSDAHGNTDSFVPSRSHDIRTFGTREPEYRHGGPPFSSDSGANKSSSYDRNDQYGHYGNERNPAGRNNRFSKDRDDREGIAITQAVRPGTEGLSGETDMAASHSDDVEQWHESGHSNLRGGHKVVGDRNINQQGRRSNDMTDFSRHSVSREDFRHQQAQFDIPKHDPTQGTVAQSDIVRPQSHTDQACFDVPSQDTVQRNQMQSEAEGTPGIGGQSNNSHHRNDQTVLIGRKPVTRWSSDDSTERKAADYSSLQRYNNQRASNYSGHTQSRGNHRHDPDHPTRQQIQLPIHDDDLRDNQTHPIAGYDRNSEDVCPGIPAKPSTSLPLLPTPSATAEAPKSLLDVDFGLQLRKSSKPPFSGPNMNKPIDRGYEHKSQISNSSPVSQFTNKHPSGESLLQNPDPGGVSMESGPPYRQARFPRPSMPPPRGQQPGTVRTPLMSSPDQQLRPAQPRAPLIRGPPPRPFQQRGVAPRPHLQPGSAPRIPIHGQQTPRPLLRPPQPQSHQQRLPAAPRLTHPSNSNTWQDPLPSNALRPQVPRQPLERPPYALRPQGQRPPLERPPNPLRPLGSRPLLERQPLTRPPMQPLLHRTRSPTTTPAPAPIVPVSDPCSLITNLPPTVTIRQLDGLFATHDIAPVEIHVSIIIIMQVHESTACPKHFTCTRNFNPLQTNM